MIPNSVISLEKDGGNSPPQYTRHNIAPLPDTLHSLWPPDFGIHDLNGL